jgi:hypothetical protein
LRGRKSAIGIARVTLCADKKQTKRQNNALTQHFYTFVPTPFSMPTITRKRDQTDNHWGQSICRTVYCSGRTDKTGSSVKYVSKWQGFTGLLQIELQN